MEREEIIEGYIRYMRIAARLSDELLTKAINELVDENPELLNKMEDLISKKENIYSMASIDKKGKDRDADILNIFEDIEDSLSIKDIEQELVESGYSNAYEIIYHAIKGDLLYIDDIEPDGVIYLALTDRGEALWELIHF